METQWEIKDSLTGYFRELLEEPDIPRRRARADTLRNIPSIISKDHNKLLMQPMEMVEFEEAMNQMVDYKAPSLDGFTTNFFHFC